MSEKRFVLCKKGDVEYIEDNGCVQLYGFDVLCEMLNEQQELIEELHISDHMGWGRAEKFEKELKQKKIYIKRLEYKVQKFKEMNYEQQDKITELEKNFDDLVKWSSEIAKRNVLLDERIGRLQQAIRIVYEKKPYPTFEDIQNEINNDI